MSAGAPAPDPVGSIDRELEARKRARLAHQRGIDYKLTGWLPGMEPEGPPAPEKPKEAQGRLFEDEEKRR